MTLSGSALERLVERFTHAWNARDMHGLREVFAEDADFVGPSGNMWHGRAAIASDCGRLFPAVFAEGRLRFQIAKVRVLSRTAALVHGIWSLTGHSGETAHYLPVRTGLGLIVAKRNSCGWHIVTAHVSDVPEEP